MITQCPKTGRTCEVTGCNGCWKDSTTQDEIIRMAREAGFEGLIEKAWGIEQLERFAALVAANEREKQAEQEPVIKIHKYNEFQTLGSLNLPIGTKLYAAPVRTKDLTDKQIEKVWNKNGGYMGMPIDFARAVIAADREKNK